MENRLGKLMESLAMTEERKIEMFPLSRFDYTMLEGVMADLRNGVLQAPVVEALREAGLVDSKLTSDLEKCEGQPECLTVLVKYFTEVMEANKELVVGTDTKYSVAPDFEFLRHLVDVYGEERAPEVPEEAELPKGVESVTDEQEKPAKEKEQDVLNAEVPEREPVKEVGAKLKEMLFKIKKDA